MKSIVWSLLLVVGPSAWGDCAPDKMMRIVIRDATPQVANTFAAEPKTIYRRGSHYLRVEERFNPQTGIHGLVVTNQRDTWMANLVDSTGQHLVDNAESYDVHMPIIGWMESPLMALEFGCEVEFMISRGVEPTRIQMGDNQLLQYERSADELTVRLMVQPDTGVPWAVGLIENGEPAYLVRYDEYETGLDANPGLFRKPPGIEFEDVESPTLEDVRLLHSSAVEAQNAGDYEVAEGFHRNTLEAVKQMPGFPLNERARVMSNLASVLNINGKPQEALRLLVPASEILVEHPSQDPGQYIVLDINTGKSLALLERFEEAEVHFLKALSRVETADAMATMYGAEAKAGYAYLLNRTNRQVKAVEGFEFALDFWSTRLPEDHVLIQDLRRELQAATSDVQKSEQP